MYVYSRWLLTDGERQNIALFADAMGAVIDDSEPQVVEVESGTLTRRVVEFVDPHDSKWDATPESTVQWIIGLADIRASHMSGSRLVGVITPSASLTEHLAADLHDYLRSMRAMRDPVTFTLNTLLSFTPQNEAIQTTSVRIEDDNARLLVQSNDHEVLRDMVGGFRGKAVGVTIRTDEGKVTVTNEGAVVFSDSTSPTAVLGLMQTIVDAQAIPMVEESTMRVRPW